MIADSQTPAPANTSSRWKIAGIILLTIVLTVGITLWLVFTLVFPAGFKPVTLSQNEMQVLEAKLERLESGARQSTRATEGTPPLSPERYSEDGASRAISLSEKELNALLATNTDMAHRLAIDLSDDLASARLLVPLDPEFPLLGGKTVKLTAGMEIRYSQGRPVAILRGVSIWGVPVPNAWLGHMKNVDLVQEFAAEPGFWQSFAAGVEAIEVKEGALRLKLKE